MALRSSTSNVPPNDHLSRDLNSHQRAPRRRPAPAGGQPMQPAAGAPGLRQSKELNKAIVDSGRESLGSLLAIVEARADEFSSVNVATALTIMSRSRQFGKGGRAPDRRGPKSEAAVLQENPIKQRLSEATKLLAGQIFRNIQSYEPQALANCSGALVKLGAPNEPLLPAIEWRAVGIIRDFNAQNLSNIAWAFAKAKQPARRLFGAVQDQALSRLGEFSSQNLSNTAWAFATAQHPSPVLFAAVASEATKRIDEFSPQGLANTLWAFAAADEAANNRFTGALVLEAQRAALSHGLHAFSNQGLANLAWGGAKAAAGASPPLPSQDGFFLSAATELETRLPALRDAELAMAAVAFREARFRHPPLLRSLCLEASRRSRTSDPSSLANIAKAAAGLSAPGLDRLMRGVRARAMRDLGSFGVLELCNVAYAMALSDSIDRPFMKAAFQSIARRSGINGNGRGPDAPRLDSNPSAGSIKQQQHLSTTSSCALFQCLMVLELPPPEPPTPSSPPPQSPMIGDEADEADESLLPEALREHLERSWRASASQTIESSTQKAVLRAIERAGMRFHAEAKTSDGLFSVDAMVTVVDDEADREMMDDEGKSTSVEAVAVEVDGPSHYSSNPPFRELGPTLLRRRLLGARVNAVVSVPFYEWDALGGVPDAEEEYIERKIRGALRQ